MNLSRLDHPQSRNLGDTALSCSFSFHVRRWPRNQQNYPFRPAPGVSACVNSFYKRMSFFSVGCIPQVFAIWVLDLARRRHLVSLCFRRLQEFQLDWGPESFLMLVIRENGEHGIIWTLSTMNLWASSHYQVDLLPAYLSSAPQNYSTCSFDGRPWIVIVFPFPFGGQCRCWPGVAALE